MLARGARDIDVLYFTDLLKKKTIIKRQYQEYYKNEAEFNPEKITKTRYYDNEQIQKNGKEITEGLEACSHSYNNYYVCGAELWQNNNFNGIFHDALKKPNENQHFPLHQQRIFLLEKEIKKVYGVKTMQEFKELGVKTVMISAASETVDRLWGDNLFVNSALTTDPNDKKRAVLLFHKLVLSTDDPKLLYTNFCTCCQGDEPCKHIQAFEPQLYIFPHSIYYISDKFINRILDELCIIIFTAHIFSSGNTQKIICDHRTLATWSCYNNWVEFTNEDDKKYEHPNFLPLLYEQKNVSTEHVVTKVDYCFEFKNMIHCSGYIENFDIGEADFSKDCTLVENEKYVCGQRKCLEAANEGNYGVTYLKKDKDDTFLVKVLKNSVQCFNLRPQHFNLLNFLGGKISENLTDKEFTQLSRQLRIKCPQICLEIPLEVYNHLFKVAMNLQPEDLDFKNLKAIFLQAMTLIGTTTASKYTVYVLVKNILYDVWFTFGLIDDLLNDKIVQMLKEFPVQQNILDKIMNLFTKEVQLDQNLNVVNEKKQTYENPSSLIKNTEKVIEESVKEVLDEAKHIAERPIKQVQEQASSMVENKLLDIKLKKMVKLLAMKKKIPEIQEEEKEEMEAMIGTKVSHVNSSVSNQDLARSQTLNKTFIITNKSPPKKKVTKPKRMLNEPQLRKKLNNVVSEKNNG